MAAEIRSVHPEAEIELIPGGRGDFIVQADDRELWNKKAKGLGFPEPQQILGQL